MHSDSSLRECETVVQTFDRGDREQKVVINRGHAYTHR